MSQSLRYTYPENGALLWAIIVFGIMAGFFWAYTFSVNAAMLAVDGKTYATVQSLFNVNVRNTMFFTFFFGGGVFSALALMINYRHWRSNSFRLLLAANLIYLLGVIVYTQQVNLPLNYYTESWDPDKLPADWTQVREQWNTANAVRVVTASTAFVLATLALFIRATPQPTINGN